ncbi:Ada metal-binding domain-containing protein [Neobacillus niacini]|uniref:Ada metal-binding domain-containing protein n=1 Tax=Neobacillus niacini TaxID=86668 RepID=UPI0021CB0AFD|nr:Ada metal-binding domain-containing protein [Neobacillus niacini]MCM3766956.1 metal-binding protein [Neobacillus niacini]
MSSEEIKFKTYTLMGADKQSYLSDKPGTYGGHRKSKIYGRMDCSAALRAIEKGGYVKNRVFFADEETAIAAGFRPCGVCLPEKYTNWKKQKEEV